MSVVYYYSLINTRLTSLKHMSRHLQVSLGLSIAILLASAAIASAQSVSCPCEASAEVKAALKRLDSPDIDRLSYQEQHARRLEILAEIRRAHPGDLFVEREYQDHSKLYGTYEPETIEEYQKLAGDHPQDPMYIYLYSRALVGTRTPEAIRGMERALAISPGFAWAHLGLANIYGEKAFEDKAKTADNLKSFMHMCPNGFHGYSYLRGVSDTEFLRAAASELRAKLAADTNAEHISEYPTLWQLEFKLTASAEHENLRKQVRADIDRLKAVPAVTGSGRGLWIIIEGYKLTGDKDGKRSTEDQILAKFPESNYADQIDNERWSSEHPWPSEADAKQKAAYNTALLAEADAEIKRRPDDQFAWLSRLAALSELKDHPATEIEDTADHLLLAAEKNRGFGYASPSIQAQVAGIYLQLNLRVEQIPALIEAGSKEEQERRDRVLKSDLLTPDLRKRESQQIEYSRWYTWPMLLGGYLKTREDEKARVVLASMNEGLSKSKPGDSAGPEEKRNYKYREATYWEWKGRLAESEGHKADALLFYQRAIALSSAKMPSGESDNDDTLAVRAAKLWKEMGGGNEGLQTLFTPVEGTADDSIGGWLAMGKPLPAFDLADVNGKKWSLDGLKGKVAFINVWATWCGPCRMELPHLQKLYDRLKDRKDVVVFSLNVDENPGLIEPFLKENSFTFPVVPAVAYVEDFIKTVSIPRNWIVTPDGTLKAEAIGFGGEGDKWVDEAIKEIDKAVTGTK